MWLWFRCSTAGVIVGFLLGCCMENLKTYIISSKQEYLLFGKSTEHRKWSLSCSPGTFHLVNGVSVPNRWHRLCLPVKLSIRSGVLREPLECGARCQSLPTGTHASPFCRAHVEIVEKTSLHLIVWQLCLERPHGDYRKLVMSIKYIQCLKEREDTP